MRTSRNKPALLSIVIPLFNEEDVFPLLKAELLKAIPAWGCPTELILIDDGSRDGTCALMNEWSTRDSSVKTISLSRNFGHQIAVTAGVDAAEGEAIVIMDADLQDPPSIVEKLLNGYCEGYDVVYGQRLERQGESAFKLLSAKMFYWLMRTFVDPNLPDNAGEFRLISRRVAEDLRRMPEHDRFLRGLITWVGYHQLAVPYTRPKRAAGETKYPFWKMLKLAITAILSFSDAPLRLITWLGFGSMALAIMLILHTLFMYFWGNIPMALGWASLSIMISFFSGLIMVSIGFVGLYISKIFIESKQRPLYLVRHTQNIQGDPFR